MRSTLETDVQANAFCHEDRFRALLQRTSSTSAVHDDDVQQLRHAFYRKGSIDRRLAAELFHANRYVPARHQAWTEFYLEALTNFFLDNRQGRCVLTAASESLLLGWLGGGETISDRAERRLALRILLRAENDPEKLERCLLLAIGGNLLRETERWLEEGERSPGVIDALDLHLIRRLLRGAGGSNPRSIRPAMAAFLLDLDRQALRFADPEGWRRLLAASLARHLWADRKGVDRTGAQSEACIMAGLSALLDHHGASAKAEDLRDEVLASYQAIQRWRGLPAKDELAGKG